MQYRNIHKQHGFTFIELVIVLAVVGGLVVMWLSQGDKVQASGKAQEGIQAVLSIESAIQESYSSVNDYSGLDNATIYEAVPSAVRGPTSSDLAHPWDTDGATVTSINSGADYTITFADVPDDGCQTLANNYLSSFDDTSIDGTSVSTPSDVASNCSGGSSDIVWTDN